MESTVRFATLAAIMVTSLSSAQTTVVYKDYYGLSDCTDTVLTKLAFIEANVCISNGIFDCANEVMQSYDDDRCETEPSAVPVPLDTCNAEDSSKYRCAVVPTANLFAVSQGTTCTDDVIPSPTKYFAVLDECTKLVSSSTGMMVKNVASVLKIATYDDTACTVNEVLTDAPLGACTTLPGTEIVILTAFAATTSAPTIVTLEPTLATLEPTLATLEPTLATLEPTLATLEPTLATLEPTLATLEPTLATLEPTLATLEPTLSGDEVTASPTDTPEDEPSSSPSVSPSVSPTRSSATLASVQSLLIWGVLLVVSHMLVQ